MDLNFDYREFQKESMERLAKIYAESLGTETTDVSESDKTFNKIQKILDCQQMEKCHPYIFTLDRLNINEEDKQKIDELYECGVKRGFIDDEIDQEKEVDSQCDCNDEDIYADTLCGGPEDSITNRPLTQSTSCGVKTKPLFNVLYSAMKDGEIKMGEFYSNATDDNMAREDCTSKLQSAGYNNITIMAIEQNVNAIDQNMTSINPGENLYGMYEDDSQEFEKQETGDITPEPPKDKETDNEKDGNKEDKENKESSEKDQEEPTFGVDSDGEKNDAEDKTNDQDNITKKVNDPNDQTEDNDSSENTDDEKTKEGSEENKDNSEEKTDNDDNSEDEKELTAAEKDNLKEEYIKTFKLVLPKISTEKSVSEMSLSERTNFYNLLSEKWTKRDPSDFMTDKDQEKLNKFIAKPKEK